MAQEDEMCFAGSPENLKSLTTIETVSATGKAISSYTIIKEKRRSSCYYENGLPKGITIDLSDKVLNGRLLPQSNDSPAPPDTTDGKQTPTMPTAAYRHS